MSDTLDIIRVGRQSYEVTHRSMLKLAEERAAGRARDSLIVVEHDPVYTIGRHRDAATNVLNPGSVPVVDVKRGGDVTFHGPGQLTVYPVVMLPDHRHDILGWLHGLEDVCISAVAGWGVEGCRDTRNTGVWVGGQKIAAVGVAVRRWVSFHGFAINNTVDLNWFRQINPCGMDSNLVTRIADHAPAPSMEELTETTIQTFSDWWSRWCMPTAEAAQTREIG